jgi:hypothetical protein
MTLALMLMSWNLQSSFLFNFFEWLEDEEPFCSDSELILSQKVCVTEATNTLQAHTFRLRHLDAYRFVTLDSRGILLNLAQDL